MRNHLADPAVQLKTWEKLKRISRKIRASKRDTQQWQPNAASKNCAHEDKRKKESLENIQKLSNSQKFK